ncbi:PGF-pre-PGF domain-containing protein [Candidatus Woesearchaeota archaeon]|nr:PGF-pre-PGF domain-containing protein [Candidatus Woesearchaeota archaeon]
MTILSLLAFLVILTTTSLACTTPVDDLYINNDTVLCNGTYSIADTGNGLIIINASDIVIECNNTIINGTSNGIGFNITGLDNVTLKNCDIRNYASQLYIVSAKNTIIDNTSFINDQSTAIKLISSNDTSIINSDFSGSSNAQVINDTGTIAFNGLFENNTVKNYNTTVIDFSEAYNWIFRNNNIYNTAYLTAGYTAIVQDNIFNNSASYFLSKVQDDTQVYNNTFMNAPSAIHLLLATAEFANNTFTNIQTAFDRPDNAAIKFLGGNTFTNVSAIMNWTLDTTIFIRNSQQLPQGNYFLNDSGNDGAIIIDADNIELDCNGVVLNGMTVGKGVVDTSNSNVTIKNCEIRDYNDGFSLTDVIDFASVSNDFSNLPGDGVGCYNNCTLLNITDNSFYAVGWPIDLDGTDYFDQITIDNVTTELDESYGIYIDNNLFNSNIRNVKINNSNGGWGGIYIGSGYNNNLTSIIIENSDSAALELYSSYNTVVDSITITSNAREGFVLLSSYNNVFKNTLITSCGRDAIKISNAASDNNTFENITITNTNDVYYDLNVATAAIDGTKLIDTHISNYTFAGAGGTLTIKESGLGELKYLQVVNGNGYHLNDGDANAIVNIASNLISVRSDLSSEFNKSAELIFYYTDSLGFSNKIPYRNGVMCPVTICTELQDADVYMFNVTQFSNYSVGGTIPLANDTLLNLSTTVQTDGSITISWSNQSGVKYNVYRNISALSAPVSSLQRIAANITTLSYVDTSVSASTTYFYVITVSDASGENQSSITSNVNVTTPATCSNAYGAWGSWGACSSSQQSRTRTRTCYVTVGNTDTDTGTQSCTSGGGGGGGGSSTATDGISQSISLSEMKNGTSNVKFSKATIDVVELEVAILENSNKVKFTVTKLATKPKILPEKAKAYGYLSIDHENLEDKYIKFAKIKFKLSKEWIAQNASSPTKIKLYRYTTQWDELETRMYLQDIVNYYFEATSPGLSYFVIGVEGEEPEVTVQEQAETQEEDLGTAAQEDQTTADQESQEEKAETQKFNPLNKFNRILFGLLLTIVIIATFMLHHHHIIQEKKTTKQPEKKKSTSKKTKRRKSSTKKS